jgi:hypothetical protein
VSILPDLYVLRSKAAFSVLRDCMLSLLVAHAGCSSILFVVLKQTDAVNLD